MGTKQEIIINPQYASYSSFVYAIPERFEKEGDTIYKARNEIKVFEVDGVKLNVKRFKVPNIFNRFIYTYIRSSKAERSFRYAEKLLKAGIYTPPPVATIHQYKNGLLALSYLITLQVDYDQNMYQFGKIPLDEKKDIIVHFAQYTAELHAKEVYHNDYSPGNILFRQSADGVDFCLVDINRMRFGPVSLKKGCANFARMWGKEDLFILLAREYAKARNVDEELCRHWILYYRSRFWKRFANKHGMPFEYE